MTLTLYEHPFASYCWKALIALYERGLPFEAHVVDDEADRARLAELWPMASIPVLVDDGAGITLPESTTIVEYLDGLGDAPRLVPADPAAALQARLWDRVSDGHVMTPMQKIVGDALRSRDDGISTSIHRSRRDREHPAVPGAAPVIIGIGQERRHRRLLVERDARADAGCARGGQDREIAQERHDKLWPRLLQKLAEIEPALQP